MFQAEQTTYASGTRTYTTNFATAVTLPAEPKHHVYQSFDVRADAKKPEKDDRNEVLDLKGDNFKVAQVLSTRCEPRAAQ